MSKHTPGPWVVFHNKYRIPAVEVDGSVWSEGFDSGVRLQSERDANAHLIAAAPDLLAALKELLDQGEGCAACGFGTPGCGCRYERARAAIAKAEGES